MLRTTIQTSDIYQSEGGVCLHQLQRYNKLHRKTFCDHTNSIVFGSLPLSLRATVPSMDPGAKSWASALVLNNIQTHSLI